MNEPEHLRLQPTIDDTLANARRLVDDFDRIVAGVENVPRGVQTSEIFFIVATVGDHRPRQLIESGRALGQSTYLLGQCYPDVPVLSIEHDAAHPDAPRAVERLRALPNVARLFGDARVLMPELAQPGDVIVIDGPKELRALKLAMHVIERKEPSYVFIHDCYRGSRIRAFLDRHVPWAFFSDDPQWVSAYCALDRYLDDDVLARWSDPAAFPRDRSYAGTFGCLPLHRGFPGAGDHLRRTLARFADNFSSSVRKRRGQAAREPHPCENG